MPRTSPTQAEVASSYTLWCEYFDTLGIDSREDFDAMLNSEKMEMLAFGFGADVDADVDIESAPPMTNMDARIGTLVRNGSTVFYVTLEGNYIEGDLAEVLFHLSVADRYEVRQTAAFADLAAGWTPSDLRNAVRREKRRLERAAKITAANAARAAEVERQRVGGLI